MTNCEKVENAITKNRRIYHDAAAAVHGCQSVRSATNQFMRKYGYTRMYDGTVFSRLATYCAIYNLWTKLKGEPVA